MDEKTANLMLEIMRVMRSDTTDLRTEVREGFRDMRTRLSAIERHLASHTIDVVDLNARYDQIMNRIERIEKRLEITPP